MKSKIITIDETDFEILKHLQQDGRKSFTDISKALGVSVATIRTRITKLLREETLRVIGRVDPYIIGFQSPADIQLSVLPEHTIDDVAREIARFPEVSYLAKVTGDFDLHMDVMCRDHNHLSKLLSRIRQIPGISKIKTNIIMDIYKMAQTDLRLVDPRSTEVDMDH